MTFKKQTLKQLLFDFRTHAARNRNILHSRAICASSLILVIAVSNPFAAHAQDEGDDKVASAIPKNIHELPGKEISFGNYNNYISTDRPWQNDKMFLLYNVGTGKFLNVGSYWGTHAVLSDVPRPFWFQRRNDRKVTALYGYKRYPLSQNDNEDFIDQFAAIKNYQIGSNYSHVGNGTSANPTSVHSQVKYNYIKVIGKDEDASTAGSSLCDAGYEPKGDTFNYQQNVDLSTQKIVAQIDLTGCQATYTSASVGGDGGEWENILSVGKDISVWNKSVYDVHMFASKRGNDGHIEVRVQCINGNYSDTTQKQIIDITDKQGENKVIDITITKESILVAGVECMPARKAVSTDNPIEDLFEQNHIEVGSSYSIIRSNATYNYVKIVTNEAQTTTESNVLKPGTSFPADYSSPITFQKTETGDLQTWGINADIDLSTCVGENENVLSIGTDIAKLDGTSVQSMDNGISVQSDEASTGNDASTGYYNLHFFYNATTHKLTLYHVNSAAETASKAIDITSVNASNQRLKVYLDGNGLVVNGVTMADENNVIKNLTSSEKTSDIQVGSQAASTDNAMGSHAIYQELSMSHAYPQDGDTWNGKTFMKQIRGSLTNWNLEWTIDLSTCISSGENILSIGEDISKWGDGLSGGNIHIYYTPSSKTIEFDAVNSKNTSSQYKVTKVLSDEELKAVNIKLTQEGLYFNGSLISGATNGDYSSSNPVIYYLTHCDYLHIGSQEGDNRSHATYTSASITSTGVEPSNPDTPVKPLGDYPEDGDKWDGREFMKEYEGNLSNWAFDFTLDLTSCTGSGENIISFGNNVANWANKGDYNIHLYYTGSNKKLQLNAARNNGSYGDWKKDDLTLSDTEAKMCHIQLSKDGLVVNGITYSGGILTEVINYLTNTSGTIQVGSKEGGSRSHATYTTLTVSEVEAPAPSPELPSFPTAGTQWDGKTAFSKTIEGNLSDKAIEAELDLSQYSTSDKTSNVLSIGTDIKVWGNGSDGATDAHANNIHFYYPKGGKLAIDIVSNDYTGSGNKYTSDNTIYIPSDNLLKISLTKDGLVVNGKTIIDASSTLVKKHVFDYLMNEATSFEVGAKQGAALSKAKYNKLDITDATSSAKTFSAKGFTQKSVASYSSEESTSSATVYYPYKNYTADGKTAFETEAYKMNFENGDYVEAEIDISTTPNRDANLFSIGTDISTWGYDRNNAENNFDNIHFFFRDKDGDNALVQVVFTNKDHNDDLKKDLVIKPNADGKLLMHILLSKKDGLKVNDKKVYYAAADDPMPTIPYKAEYASEIVKFKYENGEPALDENGKYIVVAPDEDGYADAQPIRMNTTDYMYTTDDCANNEMPVFITSQFNLELGVSGNEGTYLSWSPYLSGNDRWGTIGIFADRNLPQTDITSEMAQKTSEWFFKPVEGKKNTYQIYLKMDNIRVPKRDMSASKYYSFDTMSGTFLLQATSDHVYGNNMENYGGGYDDTKDGNELDGVEAICGDLGDGNENNQWKIFDVAEYYGLFSAANSEMSTKLNLTYSMRDPDFTRENADLNKWIVDEGMQGTNQVQVGFDQYTKKYDTTLTTPGFQTEYTDYDGKRDITQSGTVVQSGNEQFKYAKSHLNNHGRYMGVQVTNGGHGKFYQKNLQMIHPGWYIISCGGLSNVGAKLFVEFNNHMMTQDLHHVTQEEIAYFNATDKVWPYDQCVLNDGTKKPMPFYNALVAMNDDNADNGEGDMKDLKDKLTTQIAFYVSDTDTKANKTVTFGIVIPAASETSAAKSVSTYASNAVSTAEGTTSDWTVFDNFHLLFGGDNAEDPNLMLDEDATDLGYLDRSMHIFKDRPMRLKRTFDPNTWNTLVLPVNLTKNQFTELLDNDTDAKLLKIKEIKGDRLIFTPETEETEGGVYFRANKPYLVKTSKEHGQQKDGYTARIYHWADGGKTYEEIKFEQEHFVTYGVTLEPINSDLNSGEALYDFAGNKKYKTTIGGNEYDYVVNRNKEVADEDVAYDMTDGMKNESRYATFYGTLCKTFGPDETGKNAFIKGRPRLDDGKSFYMKPNGGNNFYYRKQGSGYGLKGFRCWFVYEDGNGVSGAAAAKQFAIDTAGVIDDVTDISTIERNDGAEIADQYAHGIYNLNGQKVAEGKKLSDLPAGIYIVNGKKYIVNK